MQLSIGVGRIIRSLSWKPGDRDHQWEELQWRSVMHVCAPEFNKQTHNRTKANASLPKDNIVPAPHRGLNTNRTAPLPPQIAPAPSTSRAFFRQIPNALLHQKQGYQRANLNESKSTPWNSTSCSTFRSYLIDSPTVPE